MVCMLVASVVMTFGSAMPGKEAHAQISQSDVSWGWKWRGAVSSSGDMPFWLHSNRFGELNRYSANTTYNISGSWKRTRESGISLASGGNILFQGSGQSVIRLREAYVQAGYGHFMLWAGRKREDFGLLHPELSMGTVDLSHNARPMPKITFATDGFQPVPGTRRVVYYDASLAHGWLEDTEYRYVDGVLLHQKHLYLRIFSEDAPVAPRAGLKHFAQWGGDSPIHGEAPVNLRAFRDVFISLASDSREIFEGGELQNRYQNHVGSYDFALMVNLGRYKMSISRQFILEDTPNARFGTPWDGMWGAWIELRPDSRTRWRADRPSDWRREHRPLIKAINYEHINTLDGLTRYPHRDRHQHVNYYNHRAYRGGWTYYGRAIGNPLLFGDRDHYGVVNNQIVGHHVGLMGYAGPVDWRFFSTYSRNYGAGRVHDFEGNWDIGLTDRKDQWSFMLETKTGMFHPSIEAAATLALDVGEAYARNFGVMISLWWRSR